MINVIFLYIIFNTFLELTICQVTPKNLLRCRQMCYQKMCITPPNINNYIPLDAFSFLCWNKCDQSLGPFSLNIQSASKQDSLIITDIIWDQAITNSSKQCLVTWEVFGGGLMGNLLTDGSTVELSLWSDTVYNVQVTCKNKDTGGMRRSHKLIVDTRRLINDALALQDLFAQTTERSISDGISSESEYARKKQADFSNKNKIELNNVNKQPLIPGKATRDQISTYLQKNKLLDLSNQIITFKSIIFTVLNLMLIFLGFLIVYAVIMRARYSLSPQSIDKQALIPSGFVSDGRALHV